MKHITLFDTTTQYNNATLDLPNVSLTLDNMEVHYNPYDGRLTAKYNVTDTSSATKILNSSSSISSIEIDGTTLDSVVTSYTFNTIGEHIVKYTLTDDSIKSRAFSGCSSLTSVVIPNSVTSIGNNAFDGCSSLTSISVASGNSYYDSRNNCNAIIETSSNTLIVGCKNTIIPNSVTSIGVDVFFGCSGLTNVTIPSSVTSIGSNAFFNCSDLTTLIVQATIPPTLSGITLYGTNANLVIKVPSASVNAYKSASGWSDYASKIQAI